MPAVPRAPNHVTARTVALLEAVKVFAAVPLGRPMAGRAGAAIGLREGARTREGGEVTDSDGGALKRCVAVAWMHASMMRAMPARACMRVVRQERAGLHMCACMCAMPGTPRATHAACAHVHKALGGRPPPLVPPLPASQWAATQTLRLTFFHPVENLPPSKISCVGV